MTLKHRTVVLESTSNPQKGIHDVVPASSDTSKLKGVSFPLAMTRDPQYLSDAQCLLRSEFCEFFTVTDESDVNHGITGTGLAVNSGGRRGRLSSGRVGIRCCFCREVHSSSRANQSTSFPSRLNCIYGAVGMLECRHFTKCHMVPIHLKNKLAALKKDQIVASPGRQQYWIDSAMKLGLIDSDDGIRFSSIPQNKPSPQTPSRKTPEITSEPNEITFNYFDTVEEYHKYRATQTPLDQRISRKNHKITPEDVKVRECESSDKIDILIHNDSLVKPEDKDLVPDYLYLAIAQMKPCRLTDADRVGCYKNRDLNFLGMCCKHCGGQPGFGKFFPATVRSLAQTTTSQTIVKHISTKCRSCPSTIRKTILALQEKQALKDKIAKEGKGISSTEARPRYGSRKVFFQRVWDRLHGHNERAKISGDSKEPFSHSKLSSSSIDSRKRRAVSPISATQHSSDSDGDSDIENKILFKSTIDNGALKLLDQDSMKDNSHFSSNFNFPLKKRRRVVSVSGEEEHTRLNCLRPVQSQVL